MLMKCLKFTNQMTSVLHIARHWDIIDIIAIFNASLVEVLPKLLKW